MNDLTEQILSEFRLFADCALLYNTRDESHVLQGDLYKLNNWSKVWELKFSIDKSAVLSVKDPKRYHVYYRYLGVEFSYDLKRKANIENVAAKETRVPGILCRVLGGADTKTKKMAYFTLVCPILEY